MTRALTNLTKIIPFTGKKDKASRVVDLSEVFVLQRKREGIWKDFGFPRPEAERLFNVAKKMDHVETRVIKRLTVDIEIFE